MQDDDPIGAGPRDRGATGSGSGGPFGTLDVTHLRPLGKRATTRMLIAGGLLAAKKEATRCEDEVVGSYPPPWIIGAREAHMFVVELSFSESQERLAERPAHRERLERLHDDGTVRMAGPFADDSGALLIFDVPDETALDAILAEDPYFETPGVTVVRRRRWMPIVGG